jgi:hypothetical protein
MRESVKIVKQFLQENYIDNEKMGSPDLRTAIRDVLVDLIHLADHETVSMNRLFSTAQDVYEEEVNIELSNYTGVKD